MMNKSCPWVLAVARRLFFQLRAFGILSAHASAVDQTTINSLLAARMSVLRSVLELLEIMEQRKVLAEIALGDPILFCGKNQPKDAPMAGYVDTDGPVSLETHLISWYTLINFQKDPDIRKGVTHDLVKAALWVLRDTGNFNSATAYILDLLASGSIFDVNAAKNAIEHLLMVRRLVAHDIDLIAFSLGPDALASRDWTPFWVKLVDFSGGPFRLRLIDDFEALVNYGELEVDAVRNADCYDSWILGQHSLSSILAAIGKALAPFKVDQISLFAGRISRLEEIRTDAGAMIGMLRQVRSFQFPYAANFSGAGTFARMLSESMSRWRNHLVEERALVPRQLAPLLTTDGIYGPLPERWEQVSPSLAPIMGPLVFDDTNCFKRRRYPFENEEIAHSPAIQRFLQLIEADERVDLRHAVVSLMSGMWRLPHNEQKAKLLRQFSQHSEDELSADLDDLDLQLRAEEIQRLAREVSSIGKSNDHAKEQVLERLNTLYPYSHNGLVVRAVFFNDTSQPRKALQYLIDAIALEPDEHLRWLSMSIALKRLGADADARAAFLVYETIKPDAS